MLIIQSGVLLNFTSLGHDHLTGMRVLLVLLVCHKFRIVWKRTTFFFIYQDSMVHHMLIALCFTVICFTEFSFQIPNNLHSNVLQTRKLSQITALQHLSSPGKIQ